MKKNKTIFDPPPRPMPDIYCICGCGNLFTPNRIDQLYLNKQHYDYAYNNGPRKIMNANRKKHEKILAKNDRIINKHFLTKRFDKFKIVYFEVLEADGFDFAFNIGTEIHDGVRWNFTYKYVYTVINTVPKKVKIARR
jgi:hypothetical protein